MCEDKTKSTYEVVYLFIYFNPYTVLDANSNISCIQASEHRSRVIDERAAYYEFRISFRTRMIYGGRIRPLNIGKQLHLPTRSGSSRRDGRLGRIVDVEVDPWLTPKNNLKCYGGAWSTRRPTKSSEPSPPKKSC